MKKDLIRRIKLYNGNGNHDKEYIIHLEEYTGMSLYDVIVQYGRRGTNLKEIIKERSVSLSKANSVIEQLTKSKVNKGYDITADISYENDDIKLNRKIVLNEFRMQKLFDQNILKLVDYNKLKSLLDTKDRENVTLVESIVQQKLLSLV